MKNTDKTVTVMFADEDDCLDRWIKRGFEPVSRTYHSQADPKDAAKTLTFVTLVFMKTMKPS